MRSGLVDRWRRFARRNGLGCTECGRWRFARSSLCRRHLDAEMTRVIRKYAEEIDHV